MKSWMPPFLLLLLFAGCQPAKSLAKKEFTVKEVTYYDEARAREIPVALFYPDTNRFKDMEVVLFSHGYGANKGGDNMYYTYLTENLARHVFFVVSIQHELPSDDLLPVEGIPQIVRRTNWERGAKNIGFVLEELKKNYPELNYERLTVMGHSNGGDMSVLFAATHRDAVYKLITLDQRRFAFPRTMKPEIYSLRSADQPADEGVLPSGAEAELYKMTIIKLEHTDHNQMDNDASESQRKEINELILKFLTAL
jgi:predicted dienelactone hydrolase